MTVHKQFEVVICQNDKSKNKAKLVQQGEMTAAEMKTILGYEEEPKPGAWGDKYLCKHPISGVPIRLAKNVKNREFDLALSLAYSQEILNQRWKLNGETGIIDENDNVASLQHRGLGLVFAEDMRVDPEQSAHWATLWPDGPVSMPFIIVKGISSDDTTRNTHDTGRGRSTVDMFMQSSLWPKLKKADDRRRRAKILDFAMRFVWERTGAKHDPYAPRRTHAEVMGWIARHPTILECVETIDIENGDTGRLKTICQPGTAAALHFLMGACDTDGKVYRSQEHPQEKGKQGIDWTKLDKARTFWCGLNTSPALAPVNAVIGRMTDPKTMVQGGTAKERVSVLIKTFCLYRSGKKIEEEAIELKKGEDYKKNSDGNWVLASFPILGGIDLGYGGKIEEEATETETEETVSEPVKATPEQEAKDAAKMEREEKKAKLLADRAAKKNGKASTKDKPKSKGKASKSKEAESIDITDEEIGWTPESEIEEESSEVDMGELELAEVGEGDDE